MVFPNIDEQYILICFHFDYDILRTAFLLGFFLVVVYRRR